MSELSKREILDNLNDEPNIDWGVEAIKAHLVWDKSKGKGVKILLIDTGIDLTHDQLKKSFKAGYNFFERSNDVKDEEGHGTHIAGLITSVAPEVELTVVKVLNNDGQGTYASVMDGITFAINYGFDIICMSLGVNGRLPVTMQERFAQAHNAGITMVCATGNQGANVALNPAQLDEVIAVGGLDKELNVASFSNGEHDVLAPSVDILSTYIDGKYCRMTGTSMASPLVAGGIALLISYYRDKGVNLKPNDIKNMLRELDGNIFDLTKLMD